MKEKQKKITNSIHLGGATASHSATAIGGPIVMVKASVGDGLNGASKYKLPNLTAAAPGLIRKKKWVD